MSTQDGNRPEVHMVLQRKGRIGLALALTLLLTLGLFGLLAFTFAGGYRPTSHPVATSTLPPWTPTPRPSPSPTGPLPPTLSQAIATLQAQNRLFYSGNTHLPEIALTFDDGPNPYYTPQILALLEQYHVQATFFCIGRLAAAYPTLVRQAYQAGNSIGNHSWSHPNLALLSPAYLQFQLVQTSDALQAAIGVRPTYFRPPYGKMSVEVLTQVYHLGLTTILWNDEARDWQRPGVNVIIQRIFRLARNGAIILLHDGGGDRSQTVAALPSIIEGLRQRGFQLVTIQQLVQDVQKTRSVATSGLSPVSSPMIVGLVSTIVSSTTVSLRSETDAEVSRPTQYLYTKREYKLKFSHSTCACCGLPRNLDWVVSSKHIS